MLYVIIGEDRPGTLDQRLAARPAHVERLQATAGRRPPDPRRPLPGDRLARPRPGRLLGQRHRRRIRLARRLPSAWADADPYVAAGVYGTVTVKPFKKVLPA